VDFYGDGSFYLLDSPGHATGHMCALARTSADPPEFMLLGGDVAHHGGEFRPTEYLPLPEDIRPNPLVAAFEESLYACPGALFHAVHPNQSSTEPFMQATGFIHEDSKAACDSVRRLFDFDAQDNIFTVIAHDNSLKDVVDFYPKSAVDWKKLGWKKRGTWRFLRDFDVGGEDDAFYDAEADQEYGIEGHAQK
jgi:glyoxylase-like metal-dependent hydrolase (beta-lactamase superfamily II)